MHRWSYSTWYSSSHDKHYFQHGLYLFLNEVSVHAAVAEVRVIRVFTSK